MRPPVFLRRRIVLAAPFAAWLVFGPQTTHAQAPGSAAPDAGSAAPEEVEEEEEVIEGEDEGVAGEAEPSPAATEPEPEPEAAPGPVLEPPSLTPLELEATPEPATPPVEVKLVPPGKKGWTASQTVFHLHGYMRMRAGLLKNGSLGHNENFDRLQYPKPTDPEEVHQNYDPFPYFLSIDTRRVGQKTGDLAANGVSTVQDPGCGKDCKKTTQIGGDLRLRLKPEIHLSDDIRVKAWIDVLDNVGLGTLGYGPNYRPEDLDRGSAIRVRRAWGEARNRDIGELRFGRMGADWGLGILDNGGDRSSPIDSDFSSDRDRVMGITNLAGFYFMAAYDFASQGRVLNGPQSPTGVPLDRAQRDDLSAVTAAVAHKLDPEVQVANLARGEAVFNYGLYFVWRKQLLKNFTNPSNTDYTTSDTGALFYKLNQKQFIPDLWAQFLWQGLRVELEAAFVAGSLGACPGLTTTGTKPENFVQATETPPNKSNGSCKYRELGVALEMEYRLFDERLGIYFDSGLATGDANAYGLAQTNSPLYQRGGNSGSRRITTYEFHPDYRVDLILWRTLMRRVAGAYYFKPGISYDFLRDPYGQKAGARLDVIYSRATSPQQTWGRDPNLGLELDVSLYYRSEDGPDITDGFYAMLQWGILFPFDGLGYASGYTGAPTKTQTAMILRGVAGIAF